MIEFDDSACSSNLNFRVQGEGFRLYRRTRIAVVANFVGPWIFKNR